MGYLIVILCIAFGILVIENMRVNRSVTSMNLRIHVNGTRGKSSVTEYIAAGILNSDPEVMAKMTGIVPTISYKKENKIIDRPGVARVQEQFRIMNLAAREGVKSLVLECMSISPDLQRLESRVFRPHIYVITNIRDDHREVMGMSLEDQAKSICDAIPYNCKVITNETSFLDLIREIAVKKNSTVITPELLDGAIEKTLPNGVFTENVSLALTVCKEAGINYDLALDGIIAHVQQLISPVILLKSGTNEIIFLNAFAANDVGSTRSLIRYWQKRSELGGSYSVLFNTRADRPLRTDLFAKWIGSTSSTIEKIFISGTHSGRAKVGLRRAGIELDKIRIMRPDEIKKIDKTLFDTLPNGSVVVGIGNIMGDGNRILKIIS